MAAIAFVDRRGLIEFCKDQQQPRGTMIVARHRSIDELRDLVARHAQLVPNGDLYVPGVSSAMTPEAARETIEIWRDWSFPDTTMMHGASLLTEGRN